jgi:transposase
MASLGLHEEFGISVSDDTIYRALKDLGFLHLSARPKAARHTGRSVVVSQHLPI